MLNDINPMRLDSCLAKDDRGGCTALDKVHQQANSRQFDGSLCPVG
jgi:hypothetical protein